MALPYMQAIHLGTCFRQSSQRALHALHQLVSREDGFHLAGGIRFLDVVFVFFMDATATVVVADGVAGHRVDQVGLEPTTSRL